MNLETRSESKSTKMMSIVLLTCAVILTVLAFAGIQSTRSSSGKARSATAALRLTSIRNTCVRAATSALDQARWDAVASYLTVQTPGQARAIGVALKALPTLDDLSIHGGTIEGHRIHRCPAP